MEAWPESVIATHAGLRGRPGVDLTEDVVRLAVTRFADLLVRESLPPTLGIARDGRAQSAALADLVEDAALDRGLDTVDFGEVSTPTAKLAARKRRLGGAVIVTGSHLEPDWNGLKLVAAPGYGPVDMRGLPAATSGGRSPRGHAGRDSQAAEDHVEAVCRAVDADRIRAAGLVVGWSGGVGQAPALALERLGCRPAASSPDIAFLLDSDGDRVSLVDERGGELDNETVLPLAALACEARAVIRSSDTSRTVDELVAERGGVVHVVSPGELHLVDALVRLRGDLAGEGNGGVVIPEVGVARDGLAAAAAIIGLIARTGTPLSALAAGLPRFVIRRSTIPCLTLEEAQRTLERLGAELAVAPSTNAEDGISLERGDAWALVRRSATEPVLRVTAEARTAEAAKALHVELLALLGSEARA